ncbi:Uncharacterised protein [Bordetella pertussis]|nr:Uncharacterised protein [Bordetella pertussis]
MGSEPALMTSLSLLFAKPARTLAAATGSALIP